MKGLFCLGVILLSTTTAVAEAEPAEPRAPRTWRARSGKFKIEAVLVDFDETTVRLRRGDGKQLSIELKKLSRADRQYVEKQRAAQAKQPEAKGKPPAKPARDTTAADIKSLQGRWQMIYVERDGIATDLPASVLSQFQLDFSGDGVTGYLGEMKFRINGASDPKQIVMARVKPDKRSRPILAIYGFDGKLLKICRSQSGRGRPEKLRTNKGDGNELIALKRISRE